jgi:hypothetical protein
MLDITTLAAWGEFIGGIAVVVSLVYLAVQIRTNTKNVRAANYRDLAAATSDFSRSITDPEAASLDDFAALSPEDQWRFTGLMALLMSPIHQSWDLHQRHLIDDVMWKAYARGWIDYYSNPGFKQWWESNQQWYPAEFRDFALEAAAG